MLRKAFDSGFPEKRQANLREIVLDYKDVFWTSVFSGPPAKVTPFKVNLVSIHGQSVPGSATDLKNSEVS